VREDSLAVLFRRMTKLNYLLIETLCGKGGGFPKMAGRFLQAFKPVSRFLPEVAPAGRRVGFNEKLLWTGIALVIYLVMCEVPLYGVARGGQEITYLRVIFASNQGTLMEFGIGPIVTAGLILQLIAGAGMVEFDQSNPEDRSLFTSASKFFSIVMTGFQASTYLISGVSRPESTLAAVIVFLELLAAGVILLLLDELIQKGWGIGSGISLFILAGVAQRIMWDSLSVGPPMGDWKYYGALVMFIQTLLAREPLGPAFLGRRNPQTGEVYSYPTMLGFITTVIVFIVVIYIQGVRVELPIAHSQFRGFRGKYPINLLYVSNLPVIFASALFANIYFVSQILWANLRNSTNDLVRFIIEILGTYDVPPEGGTPIPKGGLAYYVTSPRNLSQVLGDPVHALVFASILIAFCVIFSLTWLEVGGLDPGTVAKQLVDSGMLIPGFRRSQQPIELVLKRYIPIVTVLGGFIVGLVTALSDFFGVFATGTGVILSVGIIYQYYQQLMRERISEMYPAVRRLLGG